MALWRVFWMVVLLATAAAAPVEVRAERLQPRERQDLQIILEKGLRLYRATEKAFIVRVLNAVDQNNAALDSDLVKAVFQKSRTSHPKYPYPYFRRMMIAIAKSKGVGLR